MMAARRMCICLVYMSRMCASVDRRRDSSASPRKPLSQSVLLSSLCVCVLLLRACVPMCAVYGPAWVVAL
ncbi:uncharacterized protein CYBJADRAFT_72566 [Cyberlindnera jadinii NRRL Y-1542]|uniref:Uncharacterized protein n=1 Tax=Cyberlindnera jadinii (strain ATCC 18201 / CBS 1600 / BCRC 20928 / JCM 3617 / NBRC 0987 / NRRL Y-1542) TaxID=983966 RepID=A0A1E4S4A5_CYBJN|nr:hypothetical protein CYBJADRAFT_72566 [Cyberlindnera jadinii NRRL Y-1542]ODV74357.1 hypothetical protein CYBJADRAFT_72566 [Cyberlindnera jadinii NRRL Y-1542]